MNRFVVFGLAASFGALAAGCGGGGGGGGGGGDPPIDPPASISYAVATVVYETNYTITLPLVPTTTGGAPDSFSITPTLPAGIHFDVNTGVLDGLPSAVSPMTTYTIRAINDGGFASTTLDLQVILDRTIDLAAKATFSDDDVRHLLRRTHFHGTPTEFQNVQSSGVPAYVDAMVNFGATPALDAEANRYLLNVGDPAGLEGGFPNHTQVATHWLYYMLNNPNPFQEVMALFWHDHFSASSVILETSQLHWVPKQIRLWREKGSGDLRTLLLDMSRDWLMLKWLDGVVNTKQQPNENFGREWLELFTLGVDNGYTQADIVQSARAWTGYRERFNSTTNQSFVEFDPTRHDTGSKTVLGTTIPGQNTTDDYQAMVNLTVAFTGTDGKPKCAQFVSKKLFEYFAYAPAPQVVVDQLAAILANANYDLKALFAVLFKSEAFYSSKALAGIPRNPVEHVLGFVRATGLVPVDPFNAASDPTNGPPNKLSTLSFVLFNAAQLPTQPPTVNGWPIGSDWLSAQNMVDRANAILACITDRTDQTNLGILIPPLLPPAAVPPADDTANVVDALALRLNVVPSATERASYVTYLDSSVGAGGVPTFSKFDRNNAAHLNDRVRGLLYMLTQHPTFGVR